MMKSILASSLFLYSTSVFASSVAHPEIKMLWVPINRPATTKLLKQEFESEVSTSLEYSILPVLNTKIAPADPYHHPNPFGTSDKDFNTGTYLPWPAENNGPLPVINDADAKWFQDQVDEGFLPDVFQIGGHHVISEGWHSDPEDKFVFAPTLLDTLSRVRPARQMFDHVKLAILGGCNTMTNLEPHAEDGSFLDSDEINTIYHRDDAGRKSMIGSPAVVNSLEFYKNRLATEYGPGTSKYEYTRDPKKERCIPGPLGPYQNCKVTNLERIMPNSILWDGSHRFNEPYRMKQMFPNAYLVLGFSSASPSEEMRAFILGTSINRALQVLNDGVDKSDSRYIKNLLYAIINEDTDATERARMIEELRRQWTIASFEFNRDRPSGSITPALPELDANGIFNVSVKRVNRKIVTGKAPFAPYEAR